MLHHQGYSMSPQRPLITLFFTPQLYPMLGFIPFSQCWRSLTHISIISFLFSLERSLSPNTPSFRGSEWKRVNLGERDGRWLRQCQGWLLFNKLPLRGLRVPDFWTCLAPFLRCCEVHDACRRAYPHPPYVVLCLRKGLAAALTDLSLSFLPSCEAIPQTPKTPFSDKFSSSAAPWVSHNRFIKHTRKAFLRGTLTAGANSLLNTPEWNFILLSI